MRTLHRYILAEYLKAVAVSVAVFTGFAAAASLYKFSETAARSGVSPGAMVSLAGYLLPYVLLYAMPLALFTAAIIAFGRLSADNEFTAVKASGIHPGAAVAPVLAAGLAAGLLCVVLADVGLAAGFSAIRSRLLTAAPGVFEGALVPGRSVSFGAGGGNRYTINVLAAPAGRDGAAGEPRISVAVFSGAHLESLLTARSFDVGVRKRDSSGGTVAHVLRFMLRDGQMLSGLSGRDLKSGRAPGGFYRPVSFESHRLDVPVSRSMSGGLAIGYRRETMGLSQNLSAIRRFRREMERSATRTAYLGKKTAGNRGEARAIREELAREKSGHARAAHQALRQEVEFHRKLSMSFACLAFVLLGVPLGLASRQRSRAMGFALGAGVAFCGYYPLMLVGKSLAEAGTVEPWAGMWTPVIVVGLIGTAWTLRAVRR